MKNLRSTAPLLFCLFSLMLSFAPAQESDHETPDEIRQRDEAYRQVRSYPLAHIPAGVRAKAVAQRRVMEIQALAAQSSAGQTSAAQAAAVPAWTLIGPEPTIPLLSEPFTGSPEISGRVSALAVDPTNANIVYAGGADGGVWKTTNGGSNWTPLTDGEVSLAIGSIAIDPSNHNIIYVGTGEDNNNLDGYAGAGILKSIDGGTTWTHLPGPFLGPLGSTTGGASIGSLAVHPTNGQILLAGVAFAGSNGGIYRSTNGGTTWTKITSGLFNLPGTGVVFDPTNGNNVFAALGYVFGNANNGVYKSTNAGLTWTASLTAGTAPAGRIAIALAPSSPTTVYTTIASTANDSTNGSLLGMYKTTNGGTGWTQLTAAPNFCNPQCWYDMAIAVSPSNANVVYGVGVYQYATNSPTTVVRSTDGGATWSIIGTGANGTTVHTDGHAAAFSADSSTLYVGTDGGVWSTTNITAASVNWTARNSTLALTQFYNGLSMDATNVNRTFAGAQDNGDQAYTGAATWNVVAICGDGGFTAIDPSTPTTVYVSGHTCLEKSTTGGGLNTYSNVTPTIPQPDRQPFIPAVVLDPEKPQNLYFAANRIYYSTDGATTWNPMTPDLTTGTGTIAAIAVAPADSNTIYTGSSDGIIARTTTALSGQSSTWFNVSTTATRAITDIKVDATVSTTAYVTYGGFSGFVDSVGHVFKTTNGGTSWTDISGNLPNVPVTSFLIDPDFANTFYAGTDVGVFSTSNGGTSWSVLGTGLPNVGVTALAFHHASRTLRAGTHGRSAWDLSLATTATFALTVTKAGTGAGTVTSSPAGISCGATCSASFASGTVVTLTAAAGTGSTFAGWSGACTGTSTCAVTMTAAKAVTATFNTATTNFALTVAKAGTGAGTVTSSPAGISCGASCSASFASGTVVTLTAAAGTGSTFAGWSGACTGTGSCSVTMSAAQTVTATFTTSGGGGTATLTPATLSFGTVATGVTSAAKVLTLKNTGTAAMTITSIAIAGTNAADFSQTHTCGSSLAAGATCTISVKFAPTAAGARSASVSVADSATGSPQTAALSGTGTTAKLAPVSLSFGTVATGVTTAAKTVTLTNVGTTALTITAIAITGTNAADFSQTHTCGASLAASASCTFNVKFAPTAAGARSASLSVTDSASGSPQIVPLTGVGTTAKLAPASLNFGSVTVGTTSAAKVVTLTNVGTAALSITAIAITGTDPGDYAQTHTCGSSLAAGASCTISVTFKPTVKGARPAALSVTDTASGSPQKVTLSGTGA